MRSQNFLSRCSLGLPIDITGRSAIALIGFGTDGDKQARYKRSYPSTLPSGV